MLISLNPSVSEKSMVFKMCFNNIVILLIISVTTGLGIEFRFDYTYSQLAEGWLKLHIVPATWGDAQQRCHAEGAVLASPLTEELKNAMIQHVSQHSPVRTIFTGVNAIFSKGDYASVEGVPLARLPISWASGEPDNYGNEEECLAMLISNNGTMIDVKCAEVFPYVCYKKLTALVMNECGTTDSEYKVDIRTGSCYKFHHRGLTWSRAYMTCMAEGAHLAILNNEKEAAALGELFTKTPDKTIFSKYPHIAAIGFLDWGQGGSWMTIHGQTLPEAGFNRWWNNGPDNYTRAPYFSSEYCGSIVRSGVLNDVACDLSIPFICEKIIEKVDLKDMKVL